MASAARTSVMPYTPAIPIPDYEPMTENAPPPDGKVTEYAEPVGSRVTQLFPHFYEDLREMARRYLARERKAHTLSPTELVHEAYVRLDEATRRTFRGRTHFLASAAILMRHALVDHARRRGAVKRGGGWTRVDIGENAAWTEDNIHLVLAVDWVVQELDRLDPRLSALAQMRYFAGMTEAEVAEEMGYSDRWVRKQWAFTRQWMLTRTEELARGAERGEFP